MMWHSKDTARLAQITQYQLREWTAKRGVIDPDVPGRGPGNHAMFGWRTILVLSVLGSLQRDFHIEIGRWGDRARKARLELRDRSFLSLRGTKMHFHHVESVELRSSAGDTSLYGMSVDLDHHWPRLADAMHIQEPQMPLPLFGAVRGLR